MAKEKFILVSLQEEESKKLAQILSNDTSRKILDFLAEKEASESDLSTALNIPISTIHYNLQALSKGKLVEADEFHYSQKGKEILHYKLANKYIIISPKPTFGIRQKLKSILPVATIGLLGSGFVFLMHKMLSKSAVSAVADRAADEAMPLAAGIMQKSVGAGEVAQEAMQINAYDAAQQASTGFWQMFIQNPALWFLFGCIFTLLLIIIVEFIVYKKNK